MIKYSRMDSCFHNFNSTTTACMYGRTFYFTRSFITRACTWCTTTKEFFSSTWLTTDHMWTTSNKVLRKKKRSNVFSKSMSRSRGHALSYCARCQYMFMNHQIITWHRNTLSCSITWASRWYFLPTIYDLERCNSLYSYIMHAIVHGRLDIKRNKWFTAQACIIMPRSATERTGKA